MSEVHVDEPENVDQTAWVPQGHEIIPAALLLNQHVIAVGKRFVSSDKMMIDRLLESRLIDDSHHALALKIIHLFRLGTSKQNYSSMKIFMPMHGHDNTDFCPISVFIKVTRPLKPTQMKWIRVICGLERCRYTLLAQNAGILKDALSRVEEYLYEYEQVQHQAENSYHDGLD